MSGKITNCALAAGGLTSFAVVYWWIDAIGILLGIMVATAAIICLTRERTDRTKVIFTHGYHAGYHSARLDLHCQGTECVVLDMAGARVEHGDREYA